VTWQGDASAIVGRVFLARSDGPFSFADGEVVQAHFVDADELAALLATERFCPDSVDAALPLLRANAKIRGVRGAPARGTRRRGR
jgi:hypothetical protein